MESERRGERIGRLGLKALAAASLLASPVYARDSAHRLSARVEVASRVEISTPQASAYCRQLVAKAWALVRSGKVVEKGGLDFEAVLDCIPTDAKRNEFMDAHDAVEKKHGGPGTQITSRN